MGDYLTVNQSVKFTGKSKSTIRRLIISLRKSKKTGTHSSTHPGTHEYLRRVLTPQGYEWLLQKDYLKTKYGSGTHNEYPAGSQTGTHEYPKVTYKDILTTTQKKQNEYLGEKDSRITRELIQLLSKQLVEKDKQIGELLKRQSETNILLHNYQTRLLGEGSSEKEQSISGSSEVSVQGNNGVSKHKRNSKTKKVKKNKKILSKRSIPQPPKAEKQKKKGFFRRLFG